MRDYNVPTFNDEHQGVASWIEEQVAEGHTLSQDLYSLTGHWFDFKIDEDNVHILENGVGVAEVGDIVEAQTFLYELAGVDDV